MLRTHNCGELRIAHLGQTVTLAGWAHKVRDKGAVLWIDIRDRYGITQLVMEEGITDERLFAKAREVGREFVLKAEGEVIERHAKNPNIPTGNIEIRITALQILNTAKTPPFKIEDETDGGDDLRMQYRYLDLRRNIIRQNLELRHKMAQQTRIYLDGQEFIEVETPVLIKSTPEGARDFVVPSRLHAGQFYALPQSPQTFKQLLMVSGFDRYYQLVRCFRDEDLRADRQPEFTQIDCEMSFVERDDILDMFEGLAHHLFRQIKGVEIEPFQRMTYADAMRLYGTDKPDLRYGMAFAELNEVAQGQDFKVFDEAEAVLGICVEGCAEYTRKQLDELTAWVKRPQIGAKGLVYVKCQQDGMFKSSVDKFFDQAALKRWADKAQAKPGDLLLVLSGKLDRTRWQLGELRIEMAKRLGLRKPNLFKPLWVVDFPLLEWDEESQRHYAMHHPFTSPLPEDFGKLGSQDTQTLSSIRANAYDMVINGVEVGGGSIRIHDRNLQAQMFDALGFTPEEAQAQFGFLLSAFEYGAPPHGGIAFGFDRLCSVFAGVDSIRDFIAFPKNNAGRDTMIDAPSPIADDQLTELSLNIRKPNQ